MIPTVCEEQFHCYFKRTDSARFYFQQATNSSPKKKKKKVQFCTTLQTSAGSYMRVVIADKSFEFRFALTVNRNISTERRFSFQFTQLLTFCTRKPEKKPVIRLTGWKSGLLKMFFPQIWENAKATQKRKVQGAGHWQTKGDLKASFEDFCMSLRLVLWPLKGGNASHF